MKITAHTQPVVKSVTLEVSEDEATAILAALGRIGGNGPGRKVTDGAYYALKEALEAHGVNVKTYENDHKWHLDTSKVSHAYWKNQDQHMAW